MSTPHFKIQPPTWDSNKRAEWSKFHVDFCSYVIIQGGTRLVDLIHGNDPLDSSLTHSPPPLSSCHNSVVGSEKGENDVRYDISHSAAPAEGVTHTPLTTEEASLNTQFYHVMQLCLKGPAHDSILHAPNKTWTDAMALLITEYGNSTSFRKSKLILRLVDLRFEGDIDKFKQKTLSLIREIFECKVSFEEFIVIMVLQAFQGDEFNGIKLDIARQIDNGENFGIYAMLETICNSVETIKPIKKANANHTRETPSGPCSRCGGKSHSRNKCYATKHVNGTKLKDRPPAKRPPPRDGKGGKGGGKKEDTSSPPNGDASTNKLSDVLSGFKGKNMSIDEVKTAIAQCTSLHVTSRPVSRANHTPMVAHHIPVVANHTPVVANHTRPIDEAIDGFLSNMAAASPTEPKATLDDAIDDFLGACNDHGDPPHAPQDSPTHGASECTESDEVIDLFLEVIQPISSDVSTHDPSSIEDKPVVQVNVAKVLDSGSGEHLASKVVDIDRTELCMVNGYDGATPTISSGMGRVSMSVFDENGDAQGLDLDRVHQIEGIPTDLVSLGRLVEQGYTFKADSNKQILTSPSGHKIPVYIEDGIFFLGCDETHDMGCHHTHVVSEPSHHTLVVDHRNDESMVLSNYVRSNQQKVDIRELHARLGHPSHKVLKDTLLNTYGVKCSNSDLDFFCATCALGKSIRKPFGSSRDPEAKATRVGERIYTDIKDLKLTTPGRNGFTKYAIFVDEYSDWVMVFGIKAKNDTWRLIKEVDIELGLSKRDYQCTFRPDNDSASYGSLFQEELKRHKFAYDPLPPYSQARNKAERAIEAIDFKARTMLIDAPHIDFEPHYFDATQCATYTHNRVVGSRGKTPYELVKNEQPMIKQMIPFGCIGYMHAEKQKRGTKVPPHVRSEEVYMLGYRSPFSHMWKVQVQDDDKRVLYSIHVDWDTSSHGLHNALPNLSKDHLEALAEDWNIDLENAPPNVGPPQLCGENLQQPPQLCGDEPQSPQVAMEQNPVAATILNDAFNNDPHVVIPPCPAVDSIIEQNVGSETPPHTCGGHPNSGEKGGVLPEWVARCDVDDSNILNHSRIHHANVIARYAHAHKTSVEVALKSALSGENSLEWKKAIIKEINALMEHTLIMLDEDHPEYEVAVREATWSRFVLNTKRDGRFKARWVVQGCFESQELDDFSNRSHVASLDALRAFVFRYDRGSRKMMSVDIRTAFLQSDKYDIHERPRYIKVVNPLDPTQILYARLISPMYGQRSAPRRWEDTLAPWLESLGFKRGDNEPSIFYRSQDNMVILVYVDDLIADGDDASIDEFLTSLKARFEINDPVFLTLEQSIDFIGIDIELQQVCGENHQPHHTVVVMSSQAYCDRLLTNLGMQNCSPSEAPITGDINEDVPLEDKKDIEWYRSGVGGIGWLSTTTRCDLQLVFSRLGQFLAKPTVGAVKVLRQTLRYIKGTSHYAMTMPLNLTSNVFQFWCDSDHASNKATSNKRRSQTGFVCTMNGVPMVSKSTAQNVVTLSSTEAEIYAGSSAISHFQHFKFIVEELGLEGFPTPFTLQIDNSAAERFMEDTKGNSRLKHIDVREAWVKEMRDRGLVIPEHVGTDDNLADLFTKPLPAPKLRAHTQRIMRI